MKKISKADKTRIGKTLLFAGIACVTAALLMIGYNVYMEQRAKRFTHSVMEQIRAYEAQRDTIPSSSDPDPDEPVEDEPAALSADFVYDGYRFIGYLTIPSLDLELPVMSSWSYDGLSLSPCRYTGSAISGDLVIAAHNYDCHFGRLSRLDPGDEVRFTDMRGHTYRYRVVLTDTLEPGDIDQMTSGEYALSLFTCNLTGSARVTVRCERAP